MYLFIGAITIKKDAQKGKMEKGKNLFSKCHF
jgi:hypothetical protein